MNERDADASNNDPDSYSFVDGFEDESFFKVGRRNFPWGDNQPSNNDDQDCVAMTPRSTASEWENENCGDEKGLLCRRPCQNKNENIEILGTVVGVAAILMVALMLLVWKEMRERRLLALKMEEESTTKEV